LTSLDASRVMTGLVLAAWLLFGSIQALRLSAPEPQFETLPVYPRMTGTPTRPAR
jgi:hypothetical protein